MSTNTRLTNSMREAIQRRILSHAFSAREEALKAEGLELGRLAVERAVRERFGEDALDLYRRLPDGWLPKQNTLYVRVGGCDVWLNASTPLPYNISNHCLTLIETSDPLGERISEHKHKREALEREKQSEGKRIEATLATFPTVKRLIETWPEVAAFVSAIEPKFPAGVPAIVLADMNAKLGLPPANADQAPNEEAA